MTASARRVAPRDPLGESPPREGRPMGGNKGKKASKVDKASKADKASKVDKASKAGKKDARRLRKGKPSDADPASLIAAARRGAFVDEMPERAFAHFRPLAEQVPTADLPIFTGQPLLMRANVKIALAAVEPHLPAAVSALREPRLKDVFELPSLVMALDFATARVPVAKLSAGEIEKMLAEGAPWRELMLTFLEVASHPLLGLLPRERVAAVRAGSGKLDKARDFVALPGLFAEFSSALEGKHPFPADKLDLLATLGGALVQQVRPGNAAATVAKRTPESILRDQLASLVADRYDQLQVLAAVALGKRKADELLPALRSAVSFGSTETADAPESPPASGTAERPGANGTAERPGANGTAEMPEG
ncbi:hypothetical protein predicted by Glimmer/Critica [Sorangium cellulosum So ce56]|uniref:Uncharacterized protein n=2 Tax=Sorangium cellulosum TaxID=56 RepID=A9FBC6_SORC5|nr:hypothetical protein predicted by Glimmer/Critica [Sorangium cellulosum So ce56]